jgi:hypothetical protein
MSDLTDPRAPTPRALTGSTPETLDKNGTDLPLPVTGSGGSTNEPEAPCARCPFVLLDHALAAVPQPPLDHTSWAAVQRWLTDVERGLVFRREQRMVARAVHRALAAEFHSRRHIESIRRSMQRAAVREADKDAGIYWTMREAGRAAQRPVRVEVDPHAWEAFKHRAERVGTTVGEHLGRLATEALRRDVIGPPVDDGRARRTLFVRIAIDDDHWTELRHLTRSNGWTIGRYLGTLAEREAH